MCAGVDGIADHHVQSSFRRGGAPFRNTIRSTMIARCLRRESTLVQLVCSDGAHEGVGEHVTDGVDIGE
jgi:hypothetical protein